MADQTNINQNQITHKPNSFSENESADVKQIVKAVKANYSVDDDLIQSLQNRRENRRARQVFEWETARRETPQNHSIQNHLRGAA